MDLLSCISHDWSMLGTCLELDQNDLSSLQQRLPSSKEKLSEVLYKWKIQQNVRAPYTWQTIKDAVCGPIIQNRRVGKQIEEYLARKNGEIYCIINLKFCIAFFSALSPLPLIMLCLPMKNYFGPNIIFLTRMATKLSMVFKIIKNFANYYNFL